jgi:hypothetical protein
MKKFITVSTLVAGTFAAGGAQAQCLDGVTAEAKADRMVVAMAGAAAPLCAMADGLVVPASNSSSNSSSNTSSNSSR